MSELMNATLRKGIDAIRADNNGDPDPLAETMLAGAVVGPNQRRIAKELPYPWNDTFARCRQIRKAGIFKGSRIDATDGWQVDTAFWLDYLVVKGILKRKLMNEEGDT